MRKLLWYLAIFGVIAPLVWMWFSGFLLHVAYGEDTFDAAANACVFMGSGIIALLPITFFLAFLNYAICELLDTAFTRFFRFGIIIMGGLWGAGILQLSKSLFLRAGVNFTVISVISVVIGLVAGLFVGRLYRNRPVEMEPLQMKPKKTVLLLLFVVSVFSFFLGDWFSADVFRKNAWAKQKEQDIRNHLVIYRYAKEGHIDRASFHAKAMIYNDLMELKYHDLSGKVDASLIAEAQAITADIMDGAVNLRDAIPGESPKIIKAVRE